MSVLKLEVGCYFKKTWNDEMSENKDRNDFTIGRIIDIFNGGDFQTMRINHIYSNWDYRSDEWIEGENCIPLIDSCSKIEEITEDEAMVLMI